MGRRFPSIRLKSKDKKDAKKILAFSASDKAVEVNGAKGSCVRAASAIYGDGPPKLDDFESNIYENGHIVMKNDDSTAKSGKCCCNGGKIPKQCLIGTVVLSVIVFIFTGASLLITKGTGQIFSS